MFLSVIPGWLACCLLYGSSDKQQVWRQPLPAMLTKIVGGILIAVMTSLLLVSLPTISGLILALSMVCCLLPLITLVGAYGRSHLLVATMIVTSTSLVFYLLGGTA